MNIQYEFLCEHMFSFLFSTYLGLGYGNYV